MTIQNRGPTGGSDVGMGETRLERSERYWHMAAETFHSSFMARTPDMRASFQRIALSWVAFANELEQAEFSRYGATGNPLPPQPPIRWLEIASKERPAKSP